MPPEHVPQRVRAIVREVAQEFEVREADIWSDRRFRQVTVARQEAMRRVRTTEFRPGLVPSLPVIASWFRKDHSTVMYGVRRATERAEMARASISTNPSTGK